jgi:hypothetical protein
MRGTRQRAWWRAVSVAAAVSAGAPGCAIVDQYSGRAIVYNLEAEQAQEQALLLNVVRAYLRRPMQFTTVSTITGTALASASTQYTLPTNVPFRPATQGATGIAAFPPLPTWLFSGSVTGGPAFTVPVLDTQEFYDGILKAIPGQLWDLYIQANYPPDLLFNLFVQKIVMRRKACGESEHTTACEFVFINYPGRDLEIDMFQELAHYLLWLGLTTERPESQTVPLDQPNTENLNIRYVGTINTEKKNVQLLAPPAGATSDAQPTPKPFKLCFSPRSKNAADLVEGDSLCGATKDSNVIRETGTARVGMTLDPGFINSLEAIAKTKARPQENGPQLARDLHHFSKVSITIYMRHTEGIIYYLGELARRALHPDLEQRPRYFFFTSASPYDDKAYWCPCTKPSSSCSFIFRLQEGPPAGSENFLTVQYGGQWYSVAGNYDPTEPDFSSTSLDFVKQLIAVNSSAKSLPQSSVVTTVGQ